MAMLDDATKKEVEKQLKELKVPVKLIYFDKATHMAEHIKEILSEIAKLSNKVQVEIHDLAKEQDVAKQFGVEDAPVIIFKSSLVKGDARYYGIPSGYEFAGFLEMLRLAGGASPLNEAAGKYFDALAQPLKMEVFVTPQCPHCPTSAYLAIKFAASSSKVKGYVYEAMEFQEMTAKYRVMGVPKTIINEGKGEFVGGYPEDVAFMQIKKILG
ncbi:MAG: thioredoxin family protein [Candidatus Micrarchaeota archaeon]